MEYIGKLRVKLNIPTSIHLSTRGYYDILMYLQIDFNSDIDRLAINYWLDLRVYRRRVKCTTNFSIEDIFKHE